MLMVDRIAKFGKALAPSVSDDALHAEAREAKYWGYDVRQLDAVTGHHPLSFIGYLALSELSCIRRCGLDDRKLRNFLSAVERSMPDDNSYHNQTHVAGVVQCMYAHLRSSPLDSTVETCACIIAAVIHDCNHPGMSADRWREVDPGALPVDMSLEQYHLESALALMKHPANNFLDGVDPDVKRELYALVSELVLATDMAKHAELMKDIARSSKEDQSEKRPIWLLRLFIKMADLHHCISSPESHVFWAKKLYAEAHGKATDQLPPVFRTGQLHFFDKVVLPMVNTMVDVCPKAEPIKTLATTNRDCWMSAG